jgi:hypothetical protein
MSRFKAGDRIEKYRNTGKVLAGPHRESYLWQIPIGTIATVVGPSDAGWHATGRDLLVQIDGRPMPTNVDSANWMEIDADPRTRANWSAIANVWQPALAKVPAHARDGVRS